MLKIRLLTFIWSLLTFSWANALESTSIVYPGGEGIGSGKHIVFLASDHEYRAEEVCPALARILAKRHGFTCTVVFGVNDEGFIEAGSPQVSGLKALREADLLFVFARFLDLPDSEMAEFETYLEKGGPVVGLRTSSHAFQIPVSKKYAKYSFRSTTDGYEGGFGHQVLGNTWVGHYGRNHVQGTRLTHLPEQAEHPILRGFKDGVFCHAGAYVGKAREGFTVLVNSQPLQSMDPAAEVDPKKPANASAWTRTYQAKDGTEHRVFHSTQGASEDFLDESYRRLVINGVLWAVGLENQITADLEIDFVGSYQPNTFTSYGHARNVKPEDLAGFESPIMPKGDLHKPDAPAYREAMRKNKKK